MYSSHLSTFIKEDQVQVPSTSPEDHSSISDLHITAAKFSIDARKTAQIMGELLATCIDLTIGSVSIRMNHPLSKHPSLEFMFRLTRLRRDAVGIGLRDSFIDHSLQQNLTGLNACRLGTLFVQELLRHSTHGRLDILGSTSIGYNSHLL